MGKIIKSSQLSADNLNNLTIPIILCSFPKRVERLINSTRYVTLNLNIKLAEALLSIPNSQRSKKANDEIMKIISQCYKPTFLENYEILFDPSYDIDVIKVFTELAQRQKVIVNWCGRLNGSSLEYAMPEYKDYRSFRIQDYDIICVI